MLACIILCPISFCDLIQVCFSWAEYQIMQVSYYFFAITIFLSFAIKFKLYLASEIQSTI